MDDRELGNDALIWFVAVALLAALFIGIASASPSHGQVATPGVTQLRAVPQQVSVAGSGRAVRASVTRRRPVRVRPFRLKGLPPFWKLRDPRMLGFQWPVVGSHEITSPFGPRDGGFHHGTDIGCAIGQPLYASRAGKVIAVGDSRSDYGLVVFIDHGSGYQTLYGHMSRTEVQLGQFVRTRQEIGRCGQTGNASGPHVHFEMRYGGFVWDPLRFLQ